MHWITGAFQTSPSTHIKYLAGLPAITEQANVLVHSYMLRVVKVPVLHPLHELTAAPAVIPASNRQQSAKRPQSEYIWLIKKAISDINPVNLIHPQCHIGSRTIDLYPNRFSIIIPSAPPKNSDVFKQWVVGWQSQYKHFCIPFASDGSIESPSLGAAAFSGILLGATEIYNECFILSAHSSYDAEIFATRMAIQFITENMTGHVILFIDNKSVIQTLS